ncbi:MAG: copper amine oxidase N-terminal domain-containing protein [Ruminococcaceae bacterium]|nr:copper amine oxidase N-terminal domain-containing protein [Oscillospiraceae bacterium]
MKRIICSLLAVLLALSALSIVTFASDDVVYISYNKGNNSNDGLSDATPKKSLGAASSNGAFGVISDGGTMVISEKLYFGDNYTWNATAATTLTANYGGKDYKNASPASNPASGVLKIKPGCTLTVKSDLTLDDLILFSEGSKDTIVVTNGATLTITDKIVTMSKSTYNFNIVVESGAKAVINGGTYSSITGNGEIITGKNVTVSKQSLMENTGAYAYISYNAGNNSNDGLSDASPKQGLGAVDGNGVVGILKNGGTLVISGKMYVGSSYTWNTKGKVTITANYGGKDYKNTEPANNPASGVMKLKPASTFTVASDITLDDMILFQENAQCTIVVASGATFTVNENVITMSNKEHFMNVVVAKGGKAVINGGTFSSVSGDGEIVIGAKAKVLGEAQEVVKEEPPKREIIACFVDYNNGNNANMGESADKAVKTYSDGVFKRMAVGGTVVVSGKSSIGGNYDMPILVKPVTFTSVYNGVDYRGEEECQFCLADNAYLTIASDVKFENICLLREKGANTVKVTNGATLTVADTTTFKSLAADGKHYSLVVEKGATAILSAEAQKQFVISGEGTILTYTDGYSELFDKHLGASTIVELTIGNATAFVNGVSTKLDAAPINRNNRTMLPVRFLANAFGVSNDGIKWDAATRTATLTNSSTTIVITIDKPSMTVNGQSVALDSPAIIESNRTYLPVRAIANALGVSNDNIVWDGATSTATLVK